MAPRTNSDLLQEAAATEFSVYLDDIFQNNNLIIQILLQ